MTCDEAQVILTVSEAAALLRISRGLAYEGVRRGTIPAVRVGRRLLVPRASLERMMAESGSHRLREETEAAGPKE